MPPSKLTVRILCTSIPIPTRNFIFRQPSSSSPFGKLRTALAASQFQMRWLICKNHKVQSRSWSSLYHLIAKVIYSKSPANIFFLFLSGCLCKICPHCTDEAVPFFFPRLFWCAIDDAHCVRKFQLFFIVTLNGRVKRIPSGPSRRRRSIITSHFLLPPPFIDYIKREQTRWPERQKNHNQRKRFNEKKESYFYYIFFLICLSLKRRPS